MFLHMHRVPFEQASSSLHEGVPGGPISMDTARPQEILPGWSLTTPEALELPDLLILVEVCASWKPFPQLSPPFRNAPQS